MEFVCSDARAHRARVEARLFEVPGLLLPDWRAVREREYEVWERAPLVLDTAVLSPYEAVEAVCRAVRAVAASSRAR